MKIQATSGSTGKELRVQIRLYNNKLKECRESLGLTQRELATAAGVLLRDYAKLECLGVSPVDEDGEWTTPAQKIADFHCVDPEELFPDSIQKIKVSASERRVDVKELNNLLQSDINTQKLLEDKDLQRSISKVLSSLSEREEEVIRMHFGIGEHDEHTLAEVGERIGRSDRAKKYRSYDPKNNFIGREHTRQIEQKALRKLRHPCRTKRLWTYVDEDRI
jgi:transcriptional regulator with XRE-family HTH domain